MWTNLRFYLLLPLMILWWGYCDWREELEIRRCQRKGWSPRR